MTNWDRLSVRMSSDSVGRCEINMGVSFLLLGTRYLMPLRFPVAAAAAPGCPAAAAAVAEDWVLLRVVLDDQLLGERHVDLRPLGQLVDQDALALSHDLQPARDRAVTRRLACDLERHRVQRVVPHVDDVVLRHPVAGYVDVHAVDREVPVADQLAGHPAGASQPGAVDHVVEAALQYLQQVLTRLAGVANGLFVVAAELLFHHAVGEARFLLLLQLLQIFTFLDPRAAVLAGRVRTLLESLVTTDEVGAQPARFAGHGSGVTSHGCFFLPRPLNASALGRTAAVMRLGGDIGDRADLQARGLQRPDGCLPARARALHEHVDLAHPVLLGLACGVLGRQLSGERRRFPRALEADVSRRSPGDDVALRVGDGHDRVVEGALDVRRAVRDVLLFPPAGLLSLFGSRRACLLRWHGLPGLLLARDGALGALAGPRIGLGALAAHRQAAAVPQTLVAADLDLAADVCLHLASQITLHLETGFDVVTQVGQLVISEIPGAQVPIDAGSRQDFVGAGTADAKDVGQGNLHPLIARQIDAD